ncbi:MAG: dihydrolipoyl dehydrogenase [Chloroflexi bacterium]|nr:dihydrolipoyl dehydrogenase [Chloroflexota bacterium]
MPETSFDIVVIGAGPGGYHAAIRAAQLGLTAAIVEKDDGTGIGGVGGVCLNWGCIPSKSLLKNAELVNTLAHAGDWGITFDNFRADMAAAIDRSRKVSATLVQGVGYLLRQNKITLFRGAGKLTSATTVEIDDGTLLTGRNIVIATGARPRSLPGLEIDGEKIITSRQALETREVPKAIGIIGGGAIGAEFAYFFRAYGAEVTIFEMLPHLVPTEDEDVSVELERAFKKQGIKFVTSATVSGAEPRGDGMVVNYHASGADAEFECDKVLLGVGVQPNTDGLGLESAGIKLDEHGFIEINDQMQTSAAGVYAVGDVTGKLLLAHVAFAQGVIAAEVAAGRDTEPLTYADMPRAVYCQPQVAGLGLTEKQAREQGYEIVIGKVPWRAVGKAQAIGEYDGFTKIISDADSGDILGAAIVGSDATEFLAEISVVKTLEGTAAEIGLTVHAHPTLSEGIKEAALDTAGEAIHWI